jgi:protein gp37
VNDTPSDRVADSPYSSGVRPSPTPLAPGQNDLFHAKVPLSFIRQVFERIADAPQHPYQIVINRSARLPKVADELHWPANLWSGVSVDNADHLGRIAYLQTVPAVRVPVVRTITGTAARFAA